MAILALMYSCTGSRMKASGIGDIDLTGRLYPTNPVPTESLVIVDLSNDDIESQVAAIGLQGIVNRTATEKIYVKNSRCKDNRGN